MNNCKNPECGKEFVAKRKTAFYCSDNCRTSHHLQLKKNNASAPSAPASILPKQNGFQMLGFGNPGTLSGNAAFDFLLQKLQQENLTLINANETLKNANETLKDSIRELKLDAATKDRLNEAETIAKTNSGLGSITNNERLMDLAEKAIMGYFGSKNDSDSNELEGIFGDNKDLLMETVNLIKDQGEEFIACHYKMTEFYVKNPEILYKGLAAIKPKKIDQTQQPQQ